MNAIEKVMQLVPDLQPPQPVVWCSRTEAFGQRQETYDVSMQFARQRCFQLSTAARKTLSSSPTARTIEVGAGRRAMHVAPFVQSAMAARE